MIYIFNYTSLTKTSRAMNQRFNHVGSQIFNFYNLIYMRRIKGSLPKNFCHRGKVISFIPKNIVLNVLHNMDQLERSLNLLLIRLYPDILIDFICSRRTQMTPSPTTQPIEHLLLKRKSTIRANQFYKQFNIMANPVISIYKVSYHNDGMNVRHQILIWDPRTSSNFRKVHQL